MTKLTSLETTIMRPRDYNLINSDNFTLLTGLSSLKITNLDKNIVYLVTYDNLVRFRYLTELNTWDDNRAYSSKETLEFAEKRYGSNYSVLDNFKYLKVAKLQLYEFLDCRQIQMNYPRVRFIWKAFKSFVCDHYYEGEFLDRSTYVENGILTLVQGGRYEGGLKKNMREGDGIMYFSDGSRYEGKWRNDKREGKGVMFFRDGSCYDGDWMDEMKHGLGVFFYGPNFGGARYDGGWNRNMRHGVGVIYRPDLSRYQVNYQNNVRIGEAVLLQPYGSDS